MSDITVSNTSRNTHMGSEGIIGFSLGQSVCNGSGDGHAPFQPLQNTHKKITVLFNTQVHELIIHIDNTQQ